MKQISSQLWVVTFMGLAAACDNGGGAVVGAGRDASISGQGGSGGTGTIVRLDGAMGGIIDLDAAMSPVDAGTEDLLACKTEQVRASIEPTRLAFAFDKSGSMGMGDYPWHDKTLKWDPVVAATKAFFSDPSSQGIEASLVFFPSSDDDTKCLADTYVIPDVPMTPLPSAVFAGSLDAQAPDGEGTPTVAVIEGAVAYMRSQRAINPGKYVLVLATDGEPASCGTDRNNITLAVNAVAAALTEGISTYVIGVRNPPIPDAPDVTSNLSQIATAGGTTVFFLDTGTPSATKQAFASAIDQIRGASIVCDIPIPDPPAGRTFDKEKVVLTYSSGTNAPLVLAYDATCTGDDSWHYDDGSNPTNVVLCPSTCARVQADTKAILDVGFACEQVITVIP